MCGSSSVFPGAIGGLSSKLLSLSEQSRLLHRCQVKSSTISGAPCHLKRCGNRSFRTVFCRTCSQKAFLSPLPRTGQRRTQEGVVIAAPTVRWHKTRSPVSTNLSNAGLVRKKKKKRTHCRGCASGDHALGLEAQVPSLWALWMRHGGPQTLMAGKFLTCWRGCGLVEMLNEPTECSSQH